MTNRLTKVVALECAVCALTSNPNKEFHMAGEDKVFHADEVITKLNEMILQLAKKPAEKAMTETQKQNVGYKFDILTLLSDGKARLANEILCEVPTFPAGMSNQRVSALLRQLILDGRVEKEIVKGKSYFSIVEK